MCPIERLHPAATRTFERPPLACWRPGEIAAAVGTHFGVDGNLAVAPRAGRDADCLVTGSFAEFQKSTDGCPDKVLEKRLASVDSTESVLALRALEDLKTGRVSDIHVPVASRTLKDDPCHVKSLWCRRFFCGGDVFQIWFFKKQSRHGGGAGWVRSPDSNFLQNNFRPTDFATTSIRTILPLLSRTIRQVPRRNT